MRFVAPDNGSACAVMHETYRQRLGGKSLEQFSRSMDGWEFGLLMIGGEVAGAAARRRGELHIGVLEPWRRRWATRSFIRAIIDWAGQTGRPVTTGVMHGNDAGRRLVEGVGFVAVEKTERGVRYAIPS